MKYIIKIEKWKSKEEPQIGDYVICEVGDSYGKYSNDINKYLKSNIGQIINSEPALLGKLYKVIFLETPNENYAVIHTKWKMDVVYDIDNKDKYVKKFNSSKILAFSENKEDLEHMIQANKYNL